MRGIARVSKLFRRRPPRRIRRKFQRADLAGGFDAHAARRTEDPKAFGDEADEVVVDGHDAAAMFESHAVTWPSVTSYWLRLRTMS